jgi:hypothetical protein
VTILEKNEVNIDSAPLDAFDNEYGDDDVEEVCKEVFDAPEANGRSKRTMNYTKVEDIALVKAWESVTIYMVTDNGQIGKSIDRTSLNTSSRCVSFDLAFSSTSIDPMRYLIDNSCLLCF